MVCGREGKHFARSCVRTRLQAAFGVQHSSAEELKRSFSDQTRGKARCDALHLLALAARSDNGGLSDETAVAHVMVENSKTNTVEVVIGKSRDKLVSNRA